jgi:Rps23 Pro-64 3,4-dihydroxylase Tpa1-like proline 4-hydroxylase
MIDFSLSKKLSANYKGAYPFPYIVIDNFLPEYVLNQVLEENKNNQVWFSDKQQWLQQFQINKFYIPDNTAESLQTFKKVLPLTSQLVDFLNSPEVITYLSELTGIEGLEPDHLLMGGGVHKIKKGGKLSMHLDYSEHPVTKKYRRLNLLLYMNKNWKSEWKSNLELWSSKKAEKLVEIEPIFNRCVIFSITDVSLHGHPEPLQCPDDVFRYSIALYYFTESTKDKKHPVVFYDDNILPGKDIIVD